jgi:hypothetical protein
VTQRYLDDSGQVLALRWGTPTRILDFAQNGAGLKAKNTSVNWHKRLNFFRRNDDI